MRSRGLPGLGGAGAAGARSSRSSCSPGGPAHVALLAAANGRVGQVGRCCSAGQAVEGAGACGAAAACAKNAPGSARACMRRDNPRRKCSASASLYLTACSSAGPWGRLRRQSARHFEIRPPILSCRQKTPPRHQRSIDPRDRAPRFHIPAIQGSDPLAPVPSARCSEGVMQRCTREHGRPVRRLKISHDNSEKTRHQLTKASGRRAPRWPAFCTLLCQCHSRAPSQASPGPGPPPVTLPAPVTGRQWSRGAAASPTPGRSSAASAHWCPPTGWRSAP